MTMYKNDAFIKTFEQVNKFILEQRERQEKELAEIVQNYDFVVGSIECKHRLMQIFPKNVKIICSPYIADLTTIYAIKKFDVNDYYILADGFYVKPESEVKE